MKKLTILMAGFGIAVAAVPSVASAAPWQNINQRQTNLYQRIDQGVRSGSLTRGEAQRLRTDFRSLTILRRAIAPAASATGNAPTSIAASTRCPRGFATTSMTARTGAIADRA